MRELYTMAAMTREELNSLFAILIPDNNQKLVTPESVRNALVALAESSLNLAENKDFPDGDEVAGDVNFLKKILIQGSELSVPNPTNGTAKLNGVIQGDVVLSAVPYLVELTTPIVAPTEFSSVTRFPKSVREAEQPETPQTDPDAFVPYIYNTGNNRWLDHQSDFQAQLWRIEIQYTRNNTNNNRELICTMRNPISGFQIVQGQVLLAGGTYQTFETQFLFLTISDSSSSTDGYEIELLTDGINLTLDNVDITRVNLESFQ